MIGSAINIIDNMTHDMRRSSTHVEIELEEQFFEAQNGDPAIDQAHQGEVEAVEAENVAAVEAENVEAENIAGAEAESCMARDLDGQEHVIEACTASDEAQICLAEPGHGLVVEAENGQAAPPSYNIVNFS